LPVGVPGEIYVGGAGLARGYLNRPGFTAERFIPNPFGLTRGERFYRTGDLARYLEDGTIEYLGRIDAQVKVPGFRIELGDIEAAFRAQDGVAETVVLAHEQTGGDRTLVAYVVPSDSGLALDELRAAVKRRLPEYMAPARVVILSAIPLTAHGKVDRKALR